MQPVIDAFETHLGELIDRSVERVLASRHPFYSRLPADVLNKAVGGAFQAVLRDLKQGTANQFAAFLTAASQQRVQQGATPSDVMSGFNIGIETVTAFFREHFADDAAARGWWFEMIHAMSLNAAVSVSDAMIAEREQRIASQASQIRETSTPMIPIYEGIFVLPLVGSVDSHRAALVIEMLLQRVSDTRASVVIIDITGVPVVDTGVAHYLLQAARAVRLLGAEVVLVGIGADIAQTIVQLGIDLSDIVTQADLRLGMTYALARQRLAIRAM
ncbi:MAG TPA: STAS domain-containing protein [Herpetosiphonaceae bacterium]|nr:STAS domain-containing protein [Herpetosiphonaceae bacterium]